MPESDKARLVGLNHIALEVGDVLAALDVDPDAAAWQGHQPEEVVRRATTIRSATAQPASSSSEP